MIQFRPENVKLVEGGYLLKVCYKKNARFSRHRRPAVVESKMIPPETALSPLVGLLQSLQILIVVSLAHSLKSARKIFYERFQVRRLRQQNCEKFDLKKDKRDYFLFVGGVGS